MTCLRPHAGVALMLSRPAFLGDYEYLMIKRQGSHGAGKWSFPGGWMEFGETPSAAAVREFREEIGGIDVWEDEIGFVGATNDVHPEGDVHSLTLVYSGTWRSGIAVINELEKISELGWFTRVKPPSPLFTSIDKILEGRML